MKKFLIPTLIVVAISLVDSNSASAASYTLKPVSEAESNAFKNIPTVVFRIGKDTPQNIETINNELFSPDQTLDYDHTNGILNRIKEYYTDGAAGSATLFDTETFGVDAYEIEYRKITSPTIRQGNISYLGGYMCDKITLKNNVAKETCKNNLFETTLVFETHFVSVDKLEEVITEIKVAAASAEDNKKVALIKVAEKAEAVLGNLNATQTEIDEAVKQAREGLLNPIETAEKIKESEKLEQAKKDQQPTQSANPSPVITPSENNNPKTIKSPNTGSQKNSNIEILLGVCGISIISAIFFINRQKIFHQ